MTVPSFRKERCKGCRLCAAACTRGIIVFAGEINSFGYPIPSITDPVKCAGCRLCAVACPDLAVIMTGEAE